MCYTFLLNTCIMEDVKTLGTRVCLPIIYKCIKYTNIKHQTQSNLCLGMIKLEVRRILGEENWKQYVKDIWKLMDLGTTCLYMIVAVLRFLAWFEVSC